MILRGFILITW